MEQLKTRNVSTIIAILVIAVVIILVVLARIDHTIAALFIALAVAQLLG